MPDGLSHSDADGWDSHWGDLAIAAALNPAQAYRRRLVFGLLEREGPPACLIDVGSGEGSFLAEAVRRWPLAALVGLESSAVGVDLCRSKVPSAEVFHVDLLAGQDPPASHELRGTHAVCSEVLEHVDDPVLLLHNACAWLAPGCLLVVTVPGGPMSAYDRHIGHRRHFTSQELADVMRAAGLVPVAVMRAGFPFFNLYRLTVIARGERLVEDVASRNEGGSVAARVAMAAFRCVFPLNLQSSPWGWQIVGVARVPR